MKKTSKYVAYVGSYTTEGESGLYICDVKKDDSILTVREEIKTLNPSYLIMSKDEEILYSIVDDGLAAYKIQENGDLVYLNTKPIGGMRGCFLTVDSKRRYVFVAGFHDGRLSMVKLKSDGSISGLADGVFHRGHAISAGDRRLDHPKISCVCLTPDERFVCATDYGLNHMKVYSIDYEKGRISLVETVRCALDSAPRTVCFSPDGKFCYILLESSNKIEVYNCSLDGEKPVFDLKERVSVFENMYVAGVSTHMFMTDDCKYLFVSIDGLNYVSWLKRDKKTGSVTLAGKSPVSGDYPKHISFLPGTDELYVVNHDSYEIKSFNVNYKEGYMLLKGKPTKIPRGNCICFRKVK